MTTDSEAFKLKEEIIEKVNDYGKEEIHFH